MIGAVIGDVVGSVYEWNNIKTTDFPLFQESSFFTDDTVLTVATAQVILDGISFEDCYRDFGIRYPGRGYGGNFQHWLYDDTMGPYNSWGNGSAMRVAPVGFAYESIEEVLDHAKRSAEVTHDHPEGIKGAQATALAIFLARKGNDKATIKEEIQERFGYDLDRTVDQIRPTYTFDVSCQGTVPEAIIAFLESKDFEDAIRIGISLGGDSDTLVCITGGIAQAFYHEIHEEILSETYERLPEEFVEIIDTFNEKYILQ